MRSIAIDKRRLAMVWFGPESLPPSSHGLRGFYLPRRSQGCRVGIQGRSQRMLNRPFSLVILHYLKTPIHEAMPNYRLH